MTTTRTIRELAAASRPWLEKKGVDNPRLDAELLIAHALGVKRLDLYLDWDRPLTDDEIARCRELIRRRGAREPVSLILGSKEFWGLPFKVTRDTLAPRPETELLVEVALEETAQDATGTFVDVCTGTGCVAIAILSERPGLRAIATDLSAAALAVARENAHNHGLADRFEPREADLLAGVTGPLSFVVANPPYILPSERAALAPEVREHEPALALFGEDADGLGHHRRILAGAPSARFVALEIGHGQGQAMRALPGFAALRKDLAGLDRVAIYKPSPPQL